MQLKQKILFLITTTFIFSACEKVVYFDVDTQENKLVVNSFIQPDSAGNMMISLSIDPLAVGFENVRVETASIYIFKNGNLQGTFSHWLEGHYIMDAETLDAQSGDVFSIEVSAPGRETVTAETKIPISVPIEEVKIIDTIFVKVSYSAFDSLGNVIILDTIVPHYKLQFTFTDPVGEDFYSLKINYKDALNETFTCFSTDDPVFTVDGDYGLGIDDEDGKVTLCDEVFFSDITFEGTQKTITLNLLELPTDFVMDPKFVFRLNHLSEAYYKYISSASLQAENLDNPFVEPVVVFTNIEGGFGIFAGFNSAYAEVEL